MVYSYEEFLQQLGKRLRHMRDERGWTVRHLMLTHGFHLAQWQGFEKGTGISVQTLLRLCGVFEVTLEELIAGLGRVGDSESKPILAPSPKISNRSVLAKKDH